MPGHDNVALIRRWFDEIWNQRRDATVTELLDPNALGHLEGLETRSHEEFMTARKHILDAFPDFRIAIDEVLGQGDDVVVRWTANATHGGELMGLGPTHRKVSFRGLTWVKFSNGRIVEGWDAWNQGRMIAELQAAAGGQ